MPSYLHPGVYIEELPSGSRPIEGVGTSTACFIGYATQGPVAEPTLISNWDDYERQFGGLRNVDDPLGDALGHSISIFFLNGGTKAYIVRAVKEDTADSAEGTLRDAADTTDLLTVTATNPGEWGDDVVLRFTRKPARDDDGNEVFVFLAQTGTGTGDDFAPLETIGEVVPEEAATTALESVINGGASKLVTVELVGSESDLRTRLEANATTDVTLAGGTDGDEPESADYTTIFSRLLKVRDINILLMPGLQWDGGTGQSILDQAIAHCETIRNRMVIIDPQPTEELENETDVNDLDLPTSTYAALYYPWPQINNPFYNPDSNPAAARTVLVSPAAFAAGLWAKTDSRRGVWKAPAGIEFPLLGVSALEYTVEDAEQDFLNPQGVNAMRRMPGFGPVVWGTRTRSTRANPEWRYIPVRRTAIFIEESIYNGIQWAVFEPNDHRLWSSLRVNVESFMNGLFSCLLYTSPSPRDS